MRGDEGRIAAAEQERRVAERLLVLALLCRDHPERWSHAELQDELTGIAAHVIESALEGLVAKGVAVVQAGDAWAATPARALDELDMICI